jgi:hypothetical protein
MRRIRELPRNGSWKTGQKLTTGDSAIRSRMVGNLPVTGFLLEKRVWEFLESKWIWGTCSLMLKV